MEEEVERGMVLPFKPLALTFKDMHYYVPLPKVQNATCFAAAVLQQYQAVEVQFRHVGSFCAGCSIISHAAAPSKVSQSRSK